MRLVILKVKRSKYKSSLKKRAHPLLRAEKNSVVLAHDHVAKNSLLCVSAYW